MASTPPPQVVTELGTDDVLFGRGAPIVNTTGNIRFRDLVNAQKAAYSSTKCRLTKDSIARNIITTIEERGGRFLKEIKTSDLARKHAVPAGVKAWIAAGYDEIVEKVKQTLRESEKNHAMAEKEAEIHRNNNDRQLSTTHTSHDRVSSAATTTTGLNATTATSGSGITNGPVPLLWNGPFFPDGAVSSSLLPLLQQQQSLFDLQQQQQHNFRRNQIQQQQRYQVLAAATLGGMTPPNLLLSHQVTLGLEPSLSGQLSMEHYLSTMSSSDPANGINHETTNIHGNCMATTYIPSTDLSTLNASHSTTMDEILHRDAVLAALRRYRQQLEEGVKGPSSAVTDAGMAPSEQQQQSATFHHMTSPAIGNVNQVERVASSLPSPLHVNEPNRVLPIAMTRSDLPTLPIPSLSIETTGPYGDSITGTVDAPKKRAPNDDDDDHDHDHDDHAETNSKTTTNKRNRES